MNYLNRVCKFSLTSEIIAIFVEAGNGYWNALIMKQIAADGNRVIEFADQEWRLITRNGIGTSKVLIKVEPGEPIQYSTSFAMMHRLTESKNLNSDIRQIILGWSQQDAAWHLGLLLNQELSERRGNPWCNLATWQMLDGNGTTYPQEGIAEAAQQLGELTGIPVNIIGGKIKGTTPASESVTEIEPIPLPLVSGEWSLNASDSTLTFRRAKSWINGRYFRIAWYAFWVIAFLLVSVATLTVPLGLPNAGLILPYPDLLPYMGIIVSVIISALVVKNVREIANTPNRIVYDSETLSGYMNNKLCWEIPVKEIQSIYVTQIVRSRRNTYLVEYGEINLMLMNGTFTRLIYQEEEHHNEKPFRDTDNSDIMILNDWDTPLQAMGLQLARAMNIACYYDQRS